MKKRIEYIDIARGLGIILVVIGHSGSPFRNIIYLFHMALFYFISGYFYKEEYSHNPLAFLKKRIKSLYLPFVKYGLVFLCLHNLFINLSIYGDKIEYYNSITFLKCLIKILTFQNTEALLSPFWFFSSLFIVEISFSIIGFFIEKLIIKRKELIQFLIILICNGLGYYSSLYNITLTRNSHTALSVICIFYLGYLYKQYENKIKNNIYLLILSFCILVICNCYGTIELSQNRYESPLFLIVCSICGIYIVFYVSKLLCTSKFNIKFIKYAGRNTIPIIALHLLTFRFLNLIQILIYKYPLESLSNIVINTSYGWWIIYSILGVLVPCTLNYVLSKYRSIIKTKNISNTKSFSS